MTSFAAEVLGEVPRDPVERSRHQDDLVSSSAALLHQALGRRIELRLQRPAKDLFRKQDQSVLTHAGVALEEQLVEHAPVPELGHGHAGTLEQRSSQSERALNRRPLVHQVKERGLDEAGADQRPVDVEITGSQDGPW